MMPFSYVRTGYDCGDCYDVCPEPQVIRPALKGATRGMGPVLLDAARLTFISRTAAAELLDAVRRWRTSGRIVEWQHIGGDVAKMFNAVDPTMKIEGIG